jgi:hypothetical protein
VDQAPPQWKEDNFLVNNAPVGVTIRYGQNQPLIINGALDVERRNWDNDRNYSYIRQFTFSLATHMRWESYISPLLLGLTRFQKLSGCSGMAQCS